MKDCVGDEYDRFFGVMSFRGLGFYLRKYPGENLRPDN